MTRGRVPHRWVTLACALATLATLASGGAGCSSGASDDGAPTSPAYPRDGELRLNHAQSKGTHNSYHVALPGTGEPSWAYTMPTLTVQLGELGVRQVELDVQWRAGAEQLEVFHAAFVDDGTTCKTLAACLGELRAWSDAHPGHLALYVQIEAKTSFMASEADAYFERLEGELLAAFPRERVVTPDAVRGSSPTLREALTTRGWPTLGETRGKVLFAIDDTGEVREAYTRDRPSLEGRVAFVDSSPKDTFGAVAIINDAKVGQAEIAAAAAAGMLVRTMARMAGDAPDQGEIDAALASGAHFISTDFPAADAPAPRLVIPGGTPSRCNPITAPSTCTSGDIEAPSKLGR